MCDVPDGGPGAPPDRTGVLIVRAWLDDGQAFRARVTRVADLTSGPPHMTAHGSLADVRVAVDEWLTAFDTGDGTPSGSGHVAAPPRGRGGDGGGRVDGGEQP